MDENHKHSPNWQHADYLKNLVPTNQLDKSARMAAKKLKAYDFDAIACRGTSGLLIGPILAVRMKKSLIIVRKSTDACHSFQRVEGDIAARRYVIVDDCISSGRTAHVIRQEVSKFAPKAECIGIFVINSMRYNLPDSELLKTSWMTYGDDESLKGTSDG